MATCDSPSDSPSYEPGTNNSELEKETTEPENDTVEPKEYSKKDKRLERLRQLRLRSVSTS